MNKNIDQSKVETPILLEKNSSCYVYGPNALRSLLESKGLRQQDVEHDLNSDSNIKYTMPVFCFIKSPDLDGDKKWYLDYSAQNKIPRYENGFMMSYRSIHDVNGHGKLVRTTGLMFMVNIQKMESSQFEKFVADIKSHDSETQIKMLEETGYKKFTVQLSNECAGYSTLQMNRRMFCVMNEKLKLIDERGEHLSFLDECYNDPRNYEEIDNNGIYINDRSEYVNPAHMPFIYNFFENKELDSVIILNKNAKMEYYGDDDKSPFAKLQNKNPLTFYCEPGSKVAIDILIKCLEARKYSEKEGKYPEFYNATIVFMSPQLVADYQKNLDNVDTYVSMKEFIKLYKENEDYFSFRLSDCSNQKIEQLFFDQIKFSGTWENFVGFMKATVFNEKNDVKNLEYTNESVDENDEFEKSDDQNKIESKSKVEIKTSENKDNKIGDPEDHLNVFVQYLKNHWPRIFKFLNAVCNFFSWFKSKFKSNDKNSLGDTGVDNRNPKQSLIDKTSALSSQGNKPNNMENQSVSDILQKKL